MLHAAGTAQPHGFTGLVGIAVLLFAAAGFVGSLQDALDKIWEAPPRSDGVWSFLRNKLFSFSLVLAAAFLLLVSLVLSTVMTSLAGRFTTALGLPEGIVETVIATANFLLSVLIFAAIFKFVPSVFVSWRAAAAGGLFTAILFALGRFALAWYLGREAEASAYGAATSLVLLLIWIYYSAQILFLGAQFSQSFQSAGLQPRGVRVNAIAEERPEVNLAEKYFSNLVAALGLGFLLGAAVMQKPAGRRRPGEPGLLERATRLLAQLTR
jgi:YihY family inner membrane protein